MELTEFLLARIAEDEAAARACMVIAGERVEHVAEWDPSHHLPEHIPTLCSRARFPSHWVTVPYTLTGDGEWTVFIRSIEAWAVDSVSGDEVGLMKIYDEGGHSEADAQHIARWDPARVLAECEAKRRIVGWYETEEIDSGYADPNPIFITIAVLRAFAALYAGHPDFDPAWALP